MTPTQAQIAAALSAYAAEITKIYDQGKSLTIEHRRKAMTAALTAAAEAALETKEIQTGAFSVTAPYLPGAAAGAALRDMLTFFGNPRRDEWLNEQAWREAKQVCENAKAALAAEVREKDELTFPPKKRTVIHPTATVNATIERCAQWHDKQEQMMVEAQDLVAAEWHRDSAAVMRAMKEEGWLD